MSIIMGYKLDKINKRILYELDKNCRVSDNKLAKIVGRSREAVRNRIKKLITDNVITGFFANINPSKMGYMVFKLYFQLANIPEERKRFYEYIKAFPEMYWFGGNDGVWDFHCALYAKNLQVFNKRKNKIFKEFKDIIIKRDVGVLVEVEYFPRKYLIEENKEKPKARMYAGEIVHNTLDEIDQKVLTNLAKDGRMQLIILAEEIKTTVDVVRKRMRKLEEKGIIIDYKIQINHNKLGYEYFKTFLYFNNIGEKDEKRLAEYVKQHNNILFFIKQLSAWDIELEIIAKNYEEFIQIMDDIRLQFANCLRNYEFCLMREDIWFLGQKETL